MNLTRRILTDQTSRPSCHDCSNSTSSVKKQRVFQLGSFLGQTRHSGYHREDFVTDQKFRVGRPRAAVGRTRIQILTKKCIFRIPLSSDFLQIKGRKQIDGRIQNPRSNLTQIWPKLCSKTILSRAKNYLCEGIGQIRLFWRNVGLGSVICGSPSCMPCSLSLLLS